MADRYLRATGNWNGAVWASTSGGTAGSAGTPTASDVVYISANYTVTLTANATCNQVRHSNGVLNLNGYKLTLSDDGYFVSSGTNARTINLEDGVVEMLTMYPDTSSLELTGSNLTLISTNSKVIFNMFDEWDGAYPFVSFETGGKSFNDITINLGVGSSTPTHFNVEGELTCRTLQIRSRNSSSHTVNFDSLVNTGRFVAIGSSASQRLTIDSSNPSFGIATDSMGTFYGQYLNMTGNTTALTSSPAYIGSGSIAADPGSGWLVQDPPKISTLIDPLTIAPSINSNWIVVGGTIGQISSGHSGGGYTGTSYGRLVSSDTFDLYDSEIIFEKPVENYDNTQGWFGFGLISQVGGSLAMFYSGNFISTNPDEEVTRGNADGSANTAFAWQYPISTPRYLRFTLETDNQLTAYSSENGTSWVQRQTASVSDDELYLFRSVRFEMVFNRYSNASNGGSYIGSINPDLNSSPSASLASPADNTILTTTTPALSFVGIDPEGDDVTYQVQIDDNSGFSSPDNFYSDTDTGFSGSDPYDSGTTVTYTVQSALAVGAVDYYWRVRAKDPTGSDTWGEWSTARKMTTASTPPSVTSSSSSAVATNSVTLAGDVTSSNGATITERGFVYATTSTPTTSNSKKVVSGTTGSYSTSVTGLTPNQVYYWRAYAINSKGTSYGANLSFTTEPRPPVLNTGTASGLSIDSLTVTGSGVSSNLDSQTINEYGVVYGTSTSPTIANSSQTASGGSSSFNNSLSGLTENTTYYIRAYAKWRGTDYSYGNQVTFKTQQRPVVALNAPSTAGSVSDLRPYLEFTGTDSDNNSITYQLQASTSDTFSSTVIDALSASNAGFSNKSDVKTDPFYNGNQIRYTPQTDLVRGTTYYWRVRGKDASGSNLWGEWSTDRTFTVAAVLPTVTLSGVGEILDTTVEIEGVLNNNGGSAVTERGVVVATTANPTISDMKFVGAGDTFTVTATGLSASTTYFARVYATNSVGTSYSSEATFMTLQPLAPPTLTVNAATRVIDISAQVTSEVTLDGQRTVTERGIVFSTETAPDITASKVTAASGGLGTYTLLLTGLEPETTYYYRAYAINDQGAGYSSELSFTTLAEFVPDEGDGYWVMSITGSDAIVSRSQATPAYSSAALPLSDLDLEEDETYTLHIGDIEHTLGDPKVSLLYYDGPTPITVDIAENSGYSFVYDLTTYHSYFLQLHVTQEDSVAEELSVSFKDLYLAKEATYSDFVEFNPYGLFEVKIENNQIVDKRREDVIASIFNGIEGWNTTPFEVKTEGLGYFEIGDGITIVDDNSVEVESHITEYKLTIDGGMQESITGSLPALTETEYSKAGNIKKLISNTTLQVDKQNQEIEALVQDVYDNGGYIEEKFSQVLQDINQVRTTVQGAGGVNMIRNSVMYAYNNLGYPESWTTTHVDGEGSSIIIQGSAESRASGGISGNSFTLSGTKVNQVVTVRKDASFIDDDLKTYYTFSIKVKKDLVGEGYIKLSNRQEEHIIELPNGEDYLWEDFKLEGLLPQDDHYEVEIYSDQDAVAQFTDAMLTVGEYSHAWTQAPGEIGNASVSITESGVTIRQDQFKYNYTQLDALGLNVYKRIRGQEEEVFGFNADETSMSKVKATKQVSMGKVRVVPIETAGASGWAWTGVDE